VSSERNRTDHVLPQPVPSPFSTEIPVRNLPGDLAKTAFRVKSLSGTLETFLVDVGCENGKVRFSPGEFLPKDPEGKRFLPRGAPGAPGAYRVSFRRKGGQNMAGDGLEDPAVAKEPRNRNGQERSQELPFPRVPAKKGKIGAKVVNALRLHPPHDPATDISSDQRGGGEA
jgi:hypothetical protein